MSMLSIPPKYLNRKVMDWLKMADAGELVLPSFQRSYVWDPPRVANYLVALLERKPTGTFLILEADDPIQFSSRRLLGCRNDGSVGKPRELVLDGQQRLTALWGALRGNKEKRYFIRVENLLHCKMIVEEVVWRSPKWKAKNPELIWKENLVPADILWHDRDSSTGSGTLDRIAEWCKTAPKTKGGPNFLYQAIARLRERLLIEPFLQYCMLAKETEPDVAIDIFIKVNESAVKLKKIDIIVALAQSDHEVDLRSRARDFLHRSSELRHYFNPVMRKAIPEIAEWVLKVGCLKVDSEDHPDGLAPKESNYVLAINYLTERDLNELEGDLDATLNFVARNGGGATKRTLAAWPPVHVIAALQNDLRAVANVSAGAVNHLILSYLWRSFLTSRYQAIANDRLLHDFRGLREYLRRVETGSGKPNLAATVPIFDESAYPLPSAESLRRPTGVPWIGGISRLGRAIAAVVMQKNPLDWVTGQELDFERVRDLESKKKLKRHYVFDETCFPTDVLEKISIKHGLNGVLLARPSVPTGNDKDPVNFLEWIRQNKPKVTELEILRRTGSHLIPYKSLEKNGNLVWHYSNFLKARAVKVEEEIRKLTTLRSRDPDSLRWAKRRSPS